MVSAASKLDRVKDRAPFEPIAPGLDVDQLISDCSNFHAVERVDARTITDETMEPLRQLIQAHVIEGGKPLVLENWHQRSDWPRWIFNPDWLKGNHGTEAINVRDIPAQSDMPMTLKHYLNNLGVLSSKFTPDSYNGGQQRLYAKDIDCPPAWRQALQKVLPACTFYLSPTDLMSALPPDARAENLMCYFGHEGTYTPAHKEMCASLGQNIMVHTSAGADPGSSIWFMTASSDRELVAEYWLSGLGHDIEVEAHFASIDAFKDAPFPVYVVEQRLGDYILVPPLAPHQVWNRGEATMKVAWNRITPETLELAIWESLPKSRLVCRDEQYKNKAIVYETLKKYFEILSKENNSHNHDQGIPHEKIRADFRKLFKLFDVILLDEEFSLDLADGIGMDIEKIPNEFNVTCSFCRGNIFNRFLSCKNCIPPGEGEEDDVYDVCLECYSRGRSCGCISKLNWVEQHDWQQLVRDHDKFRQLVIAIDGVISDESPLEFDTAFEYLGRKTLAWVCQEQLECRPFVDITKEPEDVDDAAIQQKKKLGLLVNCHVCKIRHPNWKVAQCSDCIKSYCFGSLWRAFDIDPFDALSDHAWKCPVCLGICSCGQCRKNGKTRPYEPKGTMLGASTKHVADPRSVQSLVDFSRGNFGWLQPEHTEFLKRKRSSISTDRTDNGEGSSRGFNQSPSDVYRNPFGVFDEDCSPVAGIPIDPNLDAPNLDADETYSMRNHYTHAKPFNPNTNSSGNDVSDVGGNGQYTNDPSPVALVERGHLPLLTTSRPQADGETQSSGREETEDFMKEPRTRGRPRNQQPLLPSPKDMLTGALPSRGQESPYYSHHSKSDSYLPAVHSLSGKPQSKTQRGDVQSFRHQSFAQNINPDDHSLSLLPEISSLEKDPAAFIAAAGLKMLSTRTSLQNPHESSLRPTVNQRFGVSSTWPTDSTIPPTMSPDLGTYGADFDGASQPITVQPRMLVRDLSELGSREVAPFVPQEPPVGENYPLATVATKGKRKSTAPSSDIYTSANNIIGLGGDIIMTEPTKPMREMIVNDWVNKQKLAKTKLGNLKGRGRKRRRLVVVLKLSRESWTKWEEQKVEPDLVMKELVLRDGRVHRVLVDKRGSGDAPAAGRSVSATASTSEYASGSATGGAEPKKRGRGRPRKNPSPMLLDVDRDDEKEGEDEDEDELEVIPQPKERREGALRARKREEEAREEAAKAIENEKRAREKAIEDEENARLKAIEDKEKARLKAIKDEEQAIEEENQRIEDEERRIADEKRAAEEKKRRKEEERLQAIEDEKNRKEAERRKAYQEAKMMAAKMAEGNLHGGWGYDSEEEYEQEQYQEEEEEEEGMVTEEEQLWNEREKCWWESALPMSSFAVAIERRPGYYWKTQYITDAELALRAGESNKRIISTPSPTVKSPKIKQPLKNIRNMRKSMVSAATAVEDIVPVTQSRRKSTGGVTTSKSAISQKRAAGSNLLGSDDEFITPGKGPLNKRQVQKTHAARRSGPLESPRDRLRERGAVTKYSGAAETPEHSGNRGSDDEDAELTEAVSIKHEDVEMEEGYDDRWKRGGRRRVW